MVATEAFSQSPSDKKVGLVLSGEPRLERDSHLSKRLPGRVDLAFGEFDVGRSELTLSLTLRGGDPEESNLRDREREGCGLGAKQHLEALEGGVLNKKGLADVREETLWYLCRADLIQINHNSAPNHGGEGSLVTLGDGMQSGISFLDGSGHTVIVRQSLDVSLREQSSGSGRSDTDHPKVVGVRVDAQMDGLHVGTREHLGEPSALGHLILVSRDSKGPVRSDKES